MTGGEFLSQSDMINSIKPRCRDTSVFHITTMNLLGVAFSLNVVHKKENYEKHKINKFVIEMAETGDLKTKLIWESK